MPLMFKCSCGEVTEFEKDQDVWQCSGCGELMGRKTNNRDWDMCPEHEMMYGRPHPGCEECGQ